MTITLTFPTTAMQQRTATARMHTAVFTYNTKERIKAKREYYSRYERSIRRSQRHIGPYIP